MKLRFICNHKRSFSYPFAVILALLSFSSSCSAAVNKSTIAINVSTASEDNWFNWYQSNYVKSTNPLHTFVVCDAKSYTANNSTTVSKYYNLNVCDANGKYDDLLYTDCNDETQTYMTSANFTIRASASATSGTSMSAVKIEWIGGMTGTPSAASWTDAAKLPGSYTCSGTGTCTICVQGGSCAHPVIPQSVLGVRSDTEERRFYFRVTFTSSSRDNVTTGYDGDADKFYFMAICGPMCPTHTCAQHAPVVVPASVSGPSNFCNGLNDTNGFFTVNWTYTKIPSLTTQNYFKVSVRKQGATAPVYTYQANSAAQSFKIPSSWLTYGTTYEWQVETKLSGQGCSWDVFSPWSSGATNIVVSHRYPVPSFTVRNGGGSDCTVGGCYQAENITLNASGSSVSYGSPSYSWVLDGAGYSGVSLTRTFTTANHSAYVTVTDGDGHSCTSATKSFALGVYVSPCATGLSSSLSALYGPANLCNGLNDTDGYYAVSWQNNSLPVGARQTRYNLTVRNKYNVADSHAVSVDSSNTLFAIPTAWINYSNTYEWQVTTTVVSSDGRCSWNLPSLWSGTAGLDFAVPHRYPIPVFTVLNPSNTVDCTVNSCYIDDNLNFNAGASTTSTGSPTFSWNVDGASYSGVSFSKSFATAGHSASVRVTDSDGHSCLSPTKNFTLVYPPCPSSPNTTLSNWSCGDLCAGLDYTLLWDNNNMPGGARQTHYDVTVRNKNNTADTHTASADSSARIMTIPAGWLSYGNIYEWQVRTIVTTSNGRCSWTLDSPWSSGALNITTPHRFPTSAVKVRNITGANCLPIGCFTGEYITMDASDVSINPADFNYSWTLDGVGYSGVTFTKRLNDKSHTVKLVARDLSTGQSCSSVTYNFTLEKKNPSWNEIAPPVIR